MPSNCLISYPGHLLGLGVSPFCRDAVDVFYISSWLSCKRKVNGVKSKMFSSFEICFSLIISPREGVKLKFCEFKTNIGHKYDNNSQMNAFPAKTTKKILQKTFILCSRFLFFNRLQTYMYTSWQTEVEGKPKAPFPIATTPMCRGGCHSFPWISPLTLGP